GIQALLDAEKEAAKIVEKAREYRSQKIKDARGEASKEIESLRSKREEEFQNFQSTHTGSTDDQQREIDTETEAKIESIKSEFAKNRETVVKTLLEKVIDVQPEPHRNFKPLKA
ncbi:H+-ATPase G subunit-domain-containing protein, partial [Melampsora americana]